MFPAILVSTYNFFFLLEPSAQMKFIIDSRSIHHRLVAKAAFKDELKEHQNNVIEIKPPSSRYH